MAESEKDKPAHNQHAIDALTAFVSEYSPAIGADVEVFYSTPEIAASIFELTGQELSAAEIYTLLSQMGYTYKAMNGLSLCWLLKKV